MKKIKFLTVISVIFSLQTAFCGYFENFIDNFNFIVKNCRVVENLADNADYRKEFELRMFRLQNSAAMIEKTATEMGIRDITIGYDTKKFLDTISVKTKSRISREQYDVRSFSIADVRRQIAFLQDLQFSYEEQTFVPTGQYRDSLDIQIRFAGKWEKCKEIAFSKKAYSQYAMAEYDKRYFKELSNLSRVIEEKIKKEKIKISKEFQLVNHFNSFYSNWKISMDYLKKEHKSGRRIRMTPEYKSKLDEMELIASSVDNDLNLLAATQFKYYLPDSRFAQKKTKPEEKKKVNTETPEESVGNDLDLTPEKLTELYQKKKSEAYHAEAAINGISRKAYDRFKALHPESQQNEMDKIRNKYTKESYPPALARSMAATEIYQKYSGDKNNCSPEEIKQILSKIPRGDNK